MKKQQFLASDNDDDDEEEDDDDDEEEHIQVDFNNHSMRAEMETPGLSNLM